MVRVGDSTHSITALAPLLYFAMGAAFIWVSVRAIRKGIDSPFHLLLIIAAAGCGIMIIGLAVSEEFGSFVDFKALMHPLSLGYASVGALICVYACISSARAVWKGLQTGSISYKYKEMSQPIVYYSRADSPVSYWVNIVFGVVLFLGWSFAVLMCLEILLTAQTITL